MLRRTSPKFVTFLKTFSIFVNHFCSIGGESLAVAQNAYAVSWFKGKELNMVFGLQLSFARVGSTVNFNLMTPLYKWMNHYYKGHTCTGIVLFIGIWLEEFF